MYDFKDYDKYIINEWEEKILNRKNKVNFSNADIVLLIDMLHPSSPKFHLGHAKSFLAADTFYRRKTLDGNNVFFSNAWDSYGVDIDAQSLLEEKSPQQILESNIIELRNKINSIGVELDWDNSFSTSDNEFVKLTQEYFLHFFNMGLIYSRKHYVKYCEKCDKILTRNDLENGKCKSCSGEPGFKLLPHYYLKMNEFSERLVKNLNISNFDTSTKKAMSNWFGKIDGFEVKFKTDNMELSEFVDVFVEDVAFLKDCRQIVIGYEHDLIDKNKSRIKNYDDLLKFVNNIDHKEQFIMLEGITLNNPVNENKVAIYVSSKYETKAIVSRNNNLMQTLTKEELNTLKKNELIKEKSFFKVEDWCISRYRFWGEPIPLIHCSECGTVEEDKNNLPINIPNNRNSTLERSNIVPLEAYDEWKVVKCPICNRESKRDTQVLSNWVGSSWYWMFFEIMNNPNCHKVEKQISFYIGSQAHDTRHLIYADLISLMLYNMGKSSYFEPFKNRVISGLVYNKQKEKMSKKQKVNYSLEEIINDYGPDVLRLSVFASGSFTKGFVWDKNMLNTQRKLLNKIYNLCKKIDYSMEYKDEYEEKLIQKHRDNISDNISKWKFNIAVSHLFILVNNLNKLPYISANCMNDFMNILYPLAPQLTIVINERYFKK